MTAELSFRFFDCDNHYYEATDAFTRHIEPAYRKKDLRNFDYTPAQCQAVMRDNGPFLATCRPA